jgi:hypothetical protein
MSKTPKKTQTPLELFEAAYHLLHGKNSKYTAMNLVRPQYYEAHKKGTLEDYLPTSYDVLNALAEPGPIKEAKKLIQKAVNKCIMLGIHPAEATVSSSAAGTKDVPGVVICEATAAAYARPILPVIPMQEGVVSTMSPAPRKLQFDPPQTWSPLDKVVVFTSTPPREAPPPVSIVDRFVGSSG